MEEEYNSYDLQRRGNTTGDYKLSIRKIKKLLQKIWGYHFHKVEGEWYAHKNSRRFHHISNLAKLKGIKFREYHKDLLYHTREEINNQEEDIEITKIMFADFHCPKKLPTNHIPFVSIK